MPAFDPNQVKIAELDFNKFIVGISRLVHQTEYGIDAFSAATKFIKLQLKTLHGQSVCEGVV